MFRILVALFTLTTSALAAPKYLEDNSQDTRLACVSNLSAEQNNRLWKYLHNNLLSKGYSNISSQLRSNGYLWDGQHTVFVSKAPEGICVQYMSPNQPKVPVMHGEEFFESIEFCPVPDAAFKITWGEIEVVINRFEDEAHCIWRSGDSYECTEERQADDDDNHYFVQARVAKQGQVLIFTPPGNEPQQFISRCDAF